MLSQASFSVVYKSMPPCITLDQTKILIAHFKDVPEDSFSYRATQKFIHDHRARITTPESRRMASNGRGVTKNKNKAYVYKDKLLDVMKEVYNTPPSRVDASIWMPFPEFAEKYRNRFPSRSQRPSAIKAWLERCKVRRFYSCWQAKVNKAQFLCRKDISINKAL